MQQSSHMKIINESKDEDFLTYVRFLRDYTINKHEQKIIKQLIDHRLNKLGYMIQYGCCGTNLLIKL